MVCLQWVCSRQTRPKNPRGTSTSEELLVLSSAPRFSKHGLHAILAWSKTLLRNSHMDVFYRAVGRQRPEA